MVIATAVERRELVSSLADLIDYPGPGLAEKVAACRPQVTGDAAAYLDAFLDDIAGLSTGRIEELYSNAFDLDTLSAFEATCYPYVGHHLLGETYRPSRFMVGLLERYQSLGFAVEGAELPDHLLVMLRFVARCPDDKTAGEIVGEALLPALARMTQDGEAAGPGGTSGRRIYLRVLEAIRLVLRDQLWPGIEACAYEFKKPEATGQEACR